MPTYEYRCPNGHNFELFQKMSDEPRANCPECGQESERLLSGGAGFLFKGDGFYATDYRSASYKKAASGEASAETTGKGVGDEKGKGPSSDAKEASRPSTNSTSEGGSPPGEG